MLTNYPTNFDNIKGQKHKIDNAKIQTAIAGELYNIDTFNQPGVEQAKNYTYALMGRAGYEESAHSLQEKMATV